MHILAVNKTDTMNTYWFGGAEIRTLNILKRWVDLGHKVVLISSLFPGAPRFQEVCGIRVFRCGFPMYRNEIAPFTLDIGLARHFVRMKPDVVYLASTPFPIFFPRLLGFVASMRGDEKTKVVAHIDHLQTFNTSSSSLRSFLYKLNEQLTKTVPCDAVTTVSRFTCEKLQHFFRGKIVVTGNGVDTTIFRPMGVKVIPNSIFSWGVFYERKNFHSLIRALKIVKRKIPGARLMLAGEGPQKQELLNLTYQLGLSDSVFFLGRISTKQLVKRINQSEVIVVPSLLEGFGIPVIEAMACNKPVIASDIEALRELIRDGKNGILFPPSNIVALANAIIEVLTETKMAEHIANEGFSFSQNFSWAEVARKELEVIIY